MEEKRFDEWNLLKKAVNQRGDDKHFKEKDIWWANLGENIRFEENGKGKDFVRPVLILKKFSNAFCWIVPLSNTDKEGEYYLKFFCKEKKSNALLSQLKTLDGLRLVKKIGMISEEDFNKIRLKIKELI